jgi:hypothetical protein
MMLVSLTEAKAFLEIATATTDFDSLIGQIIEYVSDRIETFLNRDLTKSYYTSYFDSGRRKYYLNAYPIDATAVITVTVDGTTQTEDDDYYVWDDEGLVEFSWTTTYTDPKQISITWLGGYSVTTISVASVSKDILATIPDSIKFACLLQSAFVFKRRKDIGLTGVSLPDGSFNTIFSGDLLPEVKSILNSYRKHPIGH